MYRNIFMGCKCALFAMGLGVANLYIQEADGSTGIVHVDINNGSSAPSGQGDDWGVNHAYLYLQDGLARAHYMLTNSLATEVQVWVADGTYLPDQGSGYSAGTPTHSFQLENSVSIFGGFQGNETLVTARLPDTYHTILSGDIGTANSTSDNVYHVVTAGSAIDSTAVIDGCTITKGNARGSGTRADNSYVGGGIFIDQGSPKIRGCKITSNSAHDSGGGIMCLETSTAPEVRNCTIENNTVTSLSVDGSGAGLCGDWAVLVLNCKFVGNSTVGGGGGIAVSPLNASRTLALTAVNCQFVHNTSSRGGGVYFVANNGGTLSMTNCLINANESDHDGGGISFWYGAIHLVNSTVVYNEAGSDGGGGLSAYSINSPGSTVENCVFYYNESATHRDIHNNVDLDHLSVTYSDTQQTSITSVASATGSGTGDINSAPQFIDSSETDPADNDYRLTCGSGCINAGHDVDVPADTYNVNEANGTSEKTPDLNLATRIVGADTDENRVDMGAYELVAVNCATDIVPLSPCGNGRVDIDDLLAVITSWGTCSSSALGACPADVANADSEVDIDDLLAVITTWGNCSGLGDDGDMPKSVDDCMDMCSENYEPYSSDWAACVNRCVQGLCEAHIIDCD
jgi:hypothetical protein